MHRIVPTPIIEEHLRVQQYLPRKAQVAITVKLITLLRRRLTLRFAFH